MSSHRILVVLAVLCLTISAAEAQRYRDDDDYGGGDRCLGYHPTIGYFDKCTPEGAAIMRRYPNERRCLGYHPSVGYFNKCTRRGRALWEGLTYGR
jgi:hypothetical protein